MKNNNTFTETKFSRFNIWLKQNVFMLILFIVTSASAILCTVQIIYNINYCFSSGYDNKLGLITSLLVVIILFIPPVFIFNKLLPKNQEPYFAYNFSEIILKIFITLLIPIAYFVFLLLTSIIMFLSFAL